MRLLCSPPWLRGEQVHGGNNLQAWLLMEELARLGVSKVAVAPGTAGLVRVGLYGWGL